MQKVTLLFLLIGLGLNSTGQTALERAKLNLAITSNPQWVNSWQGRFNKSTEFEMLAVDKFSLDWEKYNSIIPYLKKYENMMVSNGNMAIDIYSDNTVLEEKSGITYVSFEVDNKIYLMNESDSSRAVVIQTGSFSIVEDAKWLDEHSFALYCTSFNPDYKPFITVVDITAGTISLWHCNSQGLYKDRAGYFFTKFPHIKVRNE